MQSYEQAVLGLRLSSRLVSAPVLQCPQAQSSPSTLRPIPPPLLFALLLCARPAQAAETQPIADCHTAASAYEVATGLPTGLLLAVGQVETGRPDPQTGRVEPWPWSTDESGEGHYFASAQEAIAWVQARQDAAVSSIDVGCFQVNLHYHPNAFASLSEAFDPANNARYAAALLQRLHSQTGSWPAAVALYHSADPLEGQRYSERVMQMWDGHGQPLSAPVTPGKRGLDPFVVRLSVSAAAVRVVVPSWADVRTTVTLPIAHHGLPPVFTPTR